ncbi:MAG: T9SS type A sorting domain-containing protein [Bacteroidota bacterium]
MKNLIYLFLFAGLLLSSQTMNAQCGITGPDAINSGSTATYSIPITLVSGIFWTVTGPFTINGGNTGTSINVGTTASSGSGSVCVTRFLTGAPPCCECKPISINSPCAVATGLSVSQVEIPGEGCPGDDIKFIATLIPSGAASSSSSFFWEAGTGTLGTNIFFTSTTGNMVTIPTPAINFGVWVRVTFTSPCDGSQITRITFVTWESDCEFFKIRSNEVGGTAKPQLLGEPNVFPNPFSNSAELRFEASTDAQAQLNVFNVTGQAIHSQTVQVVKGQNTIELNQLPNDQKGLLYYHLSVGEEILSTGKMIRQ